MSDTPSLPIYCINLDSRPERLFDFQKVFDPLGLRYERFPAIRGPTGVDGCRDSHFAILQKAKEENLPWVCVMEDDCEPYPEFAQELPKMLSQLWKTPNWFLFNGGPTDLKAINRVDGQLLSIPHWACTQFMIVHSRAYDTLLTQYDYTLREPVDHYYRRYPTLTWTPMLTYQRPSSSDIQDGWSMSFTNEYSRCRGMLRVFAPT